MGNILTAITAIISNTSGVLNKTTDDVIQNRVNQAGAALESYVKDAFANCIGEEKNVVNRKRSNTFSYLGNSNNPPDAILKGGDAIEIKKIKRIGTDQLQLNSSYPKNKLYSNNPKICDRSRTCEEWVEKDMLYVIGQVNDSILHNIFFVYGDIYCDSHKVYEKIENPIKGVINTLEGSEPNTGELGRFNKVDHLEISDLRVRGMWLIKSPFKYFNFLYDDKKNHLFSLIAIIPEDKYHSFENKEDFENFCNEYDVSISDEELEDPQNPAELISCKVIKYFK